MCKLIVNTGVKQTISGGECDKTGDVSHGALSKKRQYERNCFSDQKINNKGYF